MADLTQTAANVGLTNDAGSIVSVVLYGAAVTQGQPLYRKADDGKYYLCDADGEATAAASGIALTPGAANEYGVIVTSGYVDLGATLAVGTTYCVSNTAGAIMPIADVSTGEWVVILGVASQTDTLILDINVTGVSSA